MPLLSISVHFASNRDLNDEEASTAYLVTAATLGDDEGRIADLIFRILPKSARRSSRLYLQIASPTLAQVDGEQKSWARPWQQLCIQKDPLTYVSGSVFGAMELVQKFNWNTTGQSVSNSSF